MEAVLRSVREAQDIAPAGTRLDELERDVASVAEERQWLFRK